MRILLVIDQFDQGNNGTTMSAQRFAKALLEDGNEVRVAASGKPAEGKYPMPEIHFFPAGGFDHQKSGDGAGKGRSGGAPAGDRVG